MYGLMFPGQGSQFVGMGKTFYDNFKTVQEVFEEASDTLNQDMKKLLFEGPEEELTQTENTQPAILLFSTAMHRLLKDRIQDKVQVGLGHSLGEYSACVASQCLSFSEALRAVKIRGQAMQEAVPSGEGAMVAVLGASEEQVLEICNWVQEKSGEVLEPANFNAPGQVVVSGSSQAAQYLKDHFKGSELGATIKAKLIPLKVSAPFHCSLMKPAQDKMTPILEGLNFSTPQFPIIQNVTATPSNSPEEIQKNLILQISAPVRWAQSVIHARENGITTLIEVGAGKVLSGLVKKIDSSLLKPLNIETIEDFKNFENSL